MKNPIVTFEMENGDVFKAELYPEIAANTVANFVNLVQDGFYNGLIFHRVIPGFMIQGGDPEGTGMGGPGYTIKGEFSDNGVENGLSHTRGVISMARSNDYDSAGSQFFLLQGSYPEYDGLYAAFGRICDEESLSVLDEIANVPVDSHQRPMEKTYIQTIRVDTMGYSYTPVVIEGKDETNGEPED